MAVPTPPHHPLASSRARAIIVVLALFAFFFAAYVLTSSGDIFGQGDTTIRMQIAENILGRTSVDLHGWDLKNPHHMKVEWFDPRISTGREGRTFSTYLPGQPLAIVPFDYFGSRLAVHERWPFGPAVAWLDRLVGPLFGALEVTIFFMFAVRLGYGFRRSLLLAGILAFATSVWPDEQSVLEHGEVAFFLLLGFYFAYRFKEQGKGSIYLVYSGAAFGGAAITRYQDAFFAVLAVALYLLLPGSRAATVVARLGWLMLGLLGLLPFIAIDLAYDWIRFGSVTGTGHHERLFGYPMFLGIPGLLVSPGKGLLWYCPTIFLLAFAGPRFARRFPALSVSMLLMVAGMVVFYSNVSFWHGDPAWGPRYLYPAVPFLTLPLGELFRGSWRRKRVIGAVTALVVLGSLAIQFSAVSVNQWRTWYRVVVYEENHGQSWSWVASRYRYFWNIHESPLNFQIHGLYQLVYDDLRGSNKYELVPPDEDPILVRMTQDYALNQWSFWWAQDEFSWWIGQQKVILGVVTLVSIMLAAGTFLVAEGWGVFARESERERDEHVPEAA